MKDIPLNKYIHRLLDRFVMANGLIFVAKINAQNIDNGIAE